MMRARLVAVATCLVAVACAGPAGESADDTVVVEVFGPFLGNEADAFSADIARIERPGLEVRYVGSDSFERDLQRRVEIGQPPDLAIMSERNEIQRYALSGDLLAVPEPIRETAPVSTDPGRPSIDLASVAVPYRLKINSLVWYRADVFDENGWEPPETLESLGDLVDEIAGIDGGPAPWCVGLADPSRPGWPASDWIEDLVVRIGGTDAYDAWVAGDLGYTSGTMTRVFQEFRRLVLQPGATNTDRIVDVLRVSHRDSATPLLADEPGCVLYKASSAAASWLGNPMLDGRLDAFVLPGELPEVRPPVTVSVESIVRFDESSETQEVLASLAASDAEAIWQDVGGFVPISLLESPSGPYSRFVGDTYRMDASESMAPNRRSGLYSTLVSGAANRFDDLQLDLEILESLEDFEP